jgi:hypothetical protein
MYGTHVWNKSKSLTTLVLTSTANLADPPSKVSSPDHLRRNSQTNHVDHRHASGVSVIYNSSLSHKDTRDTVLAKDVRALD